jgi:NFACT protein RNA binding domain
VLCTATYKQTSIIGASSCVVRNRDPSGKRPISDIALQEAGCMTVCRSNAWSQKMITSAWWVHADQVYILNINENTSMHTVTDSYELDGLSMLVQ